MSQVKELVEDLKSGEKLLQKAAVLRLYRMGTDAFNGFMESVSPDDFVDVASDMKTILSTLLEEEKGGLTFGTVVGDYLEKSDPELIADWKNGDIRIKLAILAMRPHRSKELFDTIISLAARDSNPIIRLEGENLGMMSPADMVGITEEIDHFLEKCRTANKKESTGKGLKEKSILIVEDAGPIRHFFSQVLKGANQLFLAACIAEAKALVREHSFDVIILDISLPDGDGLDFLSWLKSGIHSGRVVMLSAFSSKEIISTAFSLGADDYFVKPITKSLVDLVDYFDRI